MSFYFERWQVIQRAFINAGMDDITDDEAKALVKKEKEGLKVVE